MSECVWASCCSTSSSLLLLLLLPRVPRSQRGEFLRIPAMCGTRNHLHFIGSIGSSENIKFFLTSLSSHSLSQQHTHTHTQAYTSFLCLSTRKHVSKTRLFVTHQIISHCILSKSHPCLSDPSYITNLFKSRMLHPKLNRSSSSTHYHTH